MAFHVEKFDCEHVCSRDQLRASHDERCRLFLSVPPGSHRPKGHEIRKGGVAQHAKKVNVGELGIETARRSRSVENHALQVVAGRRSHPFYEFLNLLFRNHRLCSRHYKTLSSGAKAPIPFRGSGTAEAVPSPIDLSQGFYQLLLAPPPPELPPPKPPKPPPPPKPPLLQPPPPPPQPPPLQPRPPPDSSIQNSNVLRGVNKISRKTIAA